MSDQPTESLTPSPEETQRKRRLWRRKRDRPQRPQRRHLRRQMPILAEVEIPVLRRRRLNFRWQGVKLSPALRPNIRLQRRTRRTLRQLDTVSDKKRPRLLDNLLNKEGVYAYYMALLLEDIRPDSRLAEFLAAHPQSRERLSGWISRTKEKQEKRQR